MPVEIFDREDLDMIQTTVQLIFNDSIEFSEYIETYAQKQNTTITAACIEYTELHDVEYTELVKLITPSLKGKIELEMQDIGLLPKTSRLVFED